MLAYDQPINRVGASGGPMARSAAGFDLLGLSSLLWRRRLMITSAALICACVGVTIGKSLSPKYTAIAQLYVDPRELQLVDRELTPRAQDVSGLAMVVESQARLITSNSVLLKVIENNHLDRDPEFGGDSKGLMSALLGLFGGEVRKGGEAKLAQTGALEAFSRHITIRKTDRSFIVDIEVWSKEPAKAATLANALAAAYLAESRSSQATAARRATSDLSGRLLELQERLRRAENTLATYKAQNNFVGTQDTLINDQQLSASSQRLASARAQTLDAQAKLDQIEASRRASTDPGAIPEALQSPTIANLRAQYAEARKRYAELAAELGPRHPALRQNEKQVDDLRRTVGEEVERFAQAARNDLTRARDYEVSLKKALETQKQQSVELSQASVRLRELERDVEASRDVYQSFLKRSRETQEQESLNTSAARIIGEARVPQQRSFPPGMSLIAMIGFVLGGLAAAGWIILIDRLRPQTSEPVPADDEGTPRKPGSRPPAEATAREPAAISAIEKPLIARMRDSDVMLTLGGILADGGIADVTKLGWPTLRTGQPPTALVQALREIRAAAVRKSPGVAMPVVAVIGAGDGNDRSIVALNFALAIAADDARVLLIDADHQAGKLSRRLNGFGKSKPSRRGWLSIGSEQSREVLTANGISILPAIRGARGPVSIQKAIARARAVGGHELAILDGPAMPWSQPDRKLLDGADALIVVLPVSIDINEAMEGIIHALGDAQAKLVGVILNELSPAAAAWQQGKQYA
ncbi:MAG TPA: exopolysaccharide transport family protein [Bradyrhizobium sp.]